MHLAAESYVDKSINGPDEFMQNNIIGTYNLLESARYYWQKLPDNKKINSDSIISQLMKFTVI